MHLTTTGYALKATIITLFMTTIHSIKTMELTQELQQPVEYALEIQKKHIRMKELDGQISTLLLERNTLTTQVKSTYKNEEIIEALRKKLEETKAKAGKLESILDTAKTLQMTTPDKQEYMANFCAAKKAEFDESIKQIASIAQLLQYFKSISPDKSTNTSNE